MIWDAIQKLFGTLLIIFGLSMALIVIGSDDWHLRIFAATVGIVSMPLGLILLFGKKQ